MKTSVLFLATLAFFGTSMAFSPATPVKLTYKIADMDLDPTHLNLQSLLKGHYQKPSIQNSATEEAVLIIHNGIDNVIISISNCGIKLHDYAEANPEAQVLRDFVAIYMSYYTGGAKILFDCSDALETAQDLTQVQQIWADAITQLRTHCLQGLSALIGLSVPEVHQETLNKLLLDTMRQVIAEVDLTNAQLQALSS